MEKNFWNWETVYNQLDWIYLFASKLRVYLRWKIQDRSSANFSVDHTEARLTVDDSGHAFVTWMDDKMIEGSYDISIQKVSSNGLLLLSLDDSDISEPESGLYYWNTILLNLMPQKRLWNLSKTGWLLA